MTGSSTEVGREGRKSLLSVVPTTDEKTSARMRKQKSRDTAPEIAVRRELHRRGLRYRIHRAVVDPRRKHDVVFVGPMVVAAVHGCFWHGCPEHGVTPKSNTAWWSEKIARNKQRDEDTSRKLADAGWELVEIWEHEDPVAAADRVEAVVRSRKP